jgi:hypothetical protein
MSKFKSLIKAKLSNYPSLAKISNSYRRRVVYTLAVLSGRKSCSKNMVTEQCITCRRPWEHFFGYYDKSPWCSSGRYVLALEVKRASRNPRIDEGASIGMIDTKDDYRFKVIDKTKTWNLQQGCMLQWLGPDFEDSRNCGSGKADLHCKQRRQKSTVIKFFQTS